MKLQFTTKLVLLATAFVGIWLGGAIAYTRQPDFYQGWGAAAWDFLLPFPLWVPCVFAAYSIGRRSLTWQIVVVFAIVEILSLNIFKIMEWIGVPSEVFLPLIRQ